VGTSALGWSMAKRAMHRIDVITDAAGGIVSRDDLKTRLPYDGPMDEIGRLTNVFNAMMDRIQHMFGVQQRFVADVSHELRTPLTAVRGHLDLIRRYGMDPESMDALESEVVRMNRLVNDLLMLARADYGGISLEKREMDLDELVSEVYRDARVLAKGRDIKLTVADYEPVRVNGDADRLKQALLNLVGNAIKFTPDGGTITLNLRRTDSDAIVEVVDTGVGISHEDQKRVFDRFFQSDESRARGLSGTPGNDGVGLGLSIAKWITEAHAGTISVTSAPGEGSTFSIRIPHVEKRSSANDAATRQRTGLIRRDRTSQQTSVASEKHTRE
jgi:two-component system, OmpR family, sensor kinase